MRARMNAVKRPRCGDDQGHKRGRANTDGYGWERMGAGECERGQAGRIRPWQI
jgi:hypothetical protein